MSQFTSIVIAISCFVFLPATSAKKSCKPLLEKLHNIQSLQRSSYSLKKGVSLRKREDKAHDKWWQCENSSTKTKKKSKKAKAKNKKR